MVGKKTADHLARNLAVFAANDTLIERVALTAGKEVKRRPHQPIVAVEAVQIVEGFVSARETIEALTSSERKNAVGRRIVDILAGMSNRARIRWRKPGQPVYDVDNAIVKIDVHESRLPAVIRHRMVSEMMSSCNGRSWGSELCPAPIDHPVAPAR